MEKETEASAQVCFTMKPDESLNMHSAQLGMSPGESAAFYVWLGRRVIREAFENPNTARRWIDAIQADILLERITVRHMALAIEKWAPVQLPIVVDMRGD
jgi:hypothetical protein